MDPFMDPHLPRRLLLSLGSNETPSSSTVGLYAFFCILFVCGSGIAAGMLTSQRVWGFHQADLGQQTCAAQEQPYIDGIPRAPVCSICAQGLTLGLMSLDSLELEVLLRSGTEKQKKQAEAILPVISDAHWLLVTLLLW
jgi:hypothetical protein